MLGPFALQQGGTTCLGGRSALLTPGGGDAWVAPVFAPNSPLAEPCPRACLSASCPTRAVGDQQADEQARGSSGHFMFQGAISSVCLLLLIMLLRLVRKPAYLTLVCLLNFASPHVHLLDCSDHAPEQVEAACRQAWLGALCGRHNPVPAHLLSCGSRKSQVLCSRSFQLPQEVAAAPGPGLPR